MGQPHEYPVLPDDQRFYKRLEVVRASAAPRSPAAARFEIDPCPTVEAARQVLESLTGWPPPNWFEPPRTSPIPEPINAAVCLLAAVALLPLELLAFHTTRPDLPAWRRRVRQITPEDVGWLLASPRVAAGAWWNRVAH